MFSMRTYIVRQALYVFQQQLKDHFAFTIFGCFHRTHRCLAQYGDWNGMAFRFQPIDQNVPIMRIGTSL